MKIIITAIILVIITLMWTIPLSLFPKVVLAFDQVKQSGHETGNIRIKTRKKPPTPRNKKNKK